MPLPKALRRLAPSRLRDDPRVRGVAVGSGLIPPRTMHSAREAALLREVAAGKRRVVEVGVYEGSSAVVLCEVLGPEAELHLIDPFGHHATALPAGWAARERATRRVVARAARQAGTGAPHIHWHPTFSVDVARGWSQPVDLVFIDGDHSEEGVAADWEAWHPFVAEGGAVVFHDAREGAPDGRGLPGPTAVVDRLFRGPGAISGWKIAQQADGAVAVERLRSSGA